MRRLARGCSGTSSLPTRTFGLNLVGGLWHPAAEEAAEELQEIRIAVGLFDDVKRARTYAERTVERADYRGLEPTLLHELDLAFFEDRYAVAGPAGQRILDQMARHGGRVSALEIRRALPETPNVDQVVARLLERGLIHRPSRGRYDFALPLFRAYLRRRANLTELSRAR